MSTQEVRGRTALTSFLGEEKISPNSERRKKRASWGEIFYRKETGRHPVGKKIVLLSNDKTRKRNAWEGVREGRDYAPPQSASGAHTARASTIVPRRNHKEGPEEGLGGR